MDKDKAKQLIENWIKNEVALKGSDFQLPVADVVIYKSFEFNNLEYYTFVMLFKIAYGIS